MLLYDRLLQVFKAQKEEYMLVYDANANSGSNAGFECTYTTFKSDNSTASPENPILVLDNSEKRHLMVYSLTLIKKLHSISRLMVSLLQAIS